MPEAALGAQIPSSSPVPYGQPSSQDVGVCNPVMLSQAWFAVLSHSYIFSLWQIRDVAPHVPPALSTRRRAAANEAAQAAKAAAAAASNRVQMVWMLLTSP